MSTRNNPELSAWYNMQQRCYNSNVPNYHRYGGRGIKVCDEWLASFESFYTYVGPRPSNEHSLDRYPDKDGDYRPGNVRWATDKEQNNNASFNIVITYNNKTQTLMQWAEEYRLTHTQLYWRLHNGWNMAEALSKPIREQIDLLEYSGRIQGVKDWAKEYNIAYETLRRRLKTGWDITTALTKPVLVNRPKKQRAR